MATIRPSSELRNNYGEISDICHETNEPVYLTKNGTGDLVVMSIEAFERLAAAELRGLLLEGIGDLRDGKKCSLEEFKMKMNEEFGFEEL